MQGLPLSPSLSGSLVAEVKASRSTRRRRKSISIGTHAGAAVCGSTECIAPMGKYTGVVIAELYSSYLILLYILRRVD